MSFYIIKCVLFVFHNDIVNYIISARNFYSIFYLTAVYTFVYLQYDNELKETNRSIWMCYTLVYKPTRTHTHTKTP